MKCNIIFEGTDCTGKTSTIKELMNILDWKQIIKFSAPKGYKEAKKVNEDLVFTLNLSEGKILDRGFLGEEIYGPIMRNYKVDYMRELESKINDNNVLIILTADQEDLIERFDGVFVSPEQQLEVDERFRKVFSKVNMKHKILINTSVYIPIQVACIIKDYLEEHKLL